MVANFRPLFNTFRCPCASPSHPQQNGEEQRGCVTETGKFRRKVLKFSNQNKYKLMHYENVNCNPNNNKNRPPINDRIEVRWSRNFATDCTRLQIRGIRHRLEKINMVCIVEGQSRVMHNVC